MNEEITLSDQVTNARNLRDKIYSIMKTDCFTTHELVNKSNLGHDQAKEMLIHLGKFAFLKTIISNSKPSHKLIFETKERNELIDNQIEHFEKQVKLQMGSIQYLQALKETDTSGLKIVR